jgi:hypothetical protein
MMIWHKVFGLFQTGENMYQLFIETLHVSWKLRTYMWGLKEINLVIVLIP